MTDLTDRIDAAMRLHQPTATAPGDDHMRTINDTLTEIRIHLARVNARFEAVEAWQVRHDAAEAIRKTDTKALLFPTIAQFIQLAAIALVAYMVGASKVITAVAP